MVWPFFGTIFLSLFVSSAPHRGGHPHSELLWVEGARNMHPPHAFVSLLCDWLLVWCFLGRKTENWLKINCSKKCHKFVVVIMNIFIMKMIEIILLASPTLTCTMCTLTSEYWTGVSDKVDSECNSVVKRESDTDRSAVHLHFMLRILTLCLSVCVLRGGPGCSAQRKPWHVGLDPQQLFEPHSV